MNAEVSIIDKGDVIIERPGAITGFPISHAEWKKLKNKIELLQKKRSFWDSLGWKDIGMILWGAFLSILISFWIPGYSDSIFQIARVMAPLIFILALACTLFHHQSAKKDDENINSKVQHIIEIMELIESNYTSEMKYDKDI